MPAPLYDLRERAAVVTGAASGIGRGIVVALARAGANVVGVDIAEAGETVAEAHAEGSGQVATLRSDLTAEGAAEHVGDEAVRAFGSLDIWVNCAGKLLVRPVIDTSVADWRAIFAINVEAALMGCQAAARRMIADGRGGRIINVTSVANLQPSADLGAYTASKGALAGLTRTLALELAEHGITVNAVAPTATDTPLNANAFTPAVRKSYEERIPLGRIAVPEEMADVVVFLASHASRFITGQELVIDGGLTINGNMGHARS